MKRSCLWLPMLAFAASAAHGGDGKMKMLVLGMDGLDPKLLARWMGAGKLPTFKQFAESGVFMPLATSMPPQSPVAWSNFISGADPGTHQIYDFIHRKVETRTTRGGGSVRFILPYLSTSENTKPENPRAGYAWPLWAGKDSDWFLPTSLGEIRSLRQGPSFWTYLVGAGVETTIYRVPANYPPPVSVEGRGAFRCICGMGTPDLHGTYGEFTVFKEELRTDRTVGGGAFVKLEVDNHHAVAQLKGPGNYLRRPDAKDESQPRLLADIKIVRDPQQPAVRLTLGDVTLVMRAGEWSDWVPVEFETGIPWSWLVGVGMPTGMPAMVRIYVKQVHPLNIYVSPLNIDPRNQAMPMATPQDFATEVADACGPYYTTGIPEDTKALREGALNEDEFLQLVRLLAAERAAQYAYALENFDEGFLFFYFGHTDQLAHMFWRDIDPGHPGRKPEQEGKYDKVIEETYIEMDERLRQALAAVDDDDILIVMSDHGFNSFRRGMNVNTWLEENGYLTVRRDDKGSRGLLFNIDFSRSEAYAVGLNCLYLNLRGREPDGIVDPSRRRALLEELREKLLAVRDEDGQAAIDTVYVVEDVYPGADPAIAPDILIGFAENYRSSWDTALGGQPAGLFEDNKDRWSGDHCIAAHLAPGSILANRRITLADPSLSDLAPTILTAFGVTPPPAMIGRDIFGQ